MSKIFKEEFADLLVPAFRQPKDVVRKEESYFKLIGCKPKKIIREHYKDGESSGWMWAQNRIELGVDLPSI